MSKNISKLTNVLMTSSSFLCYDVIIILMCFDRQKSGRFLLNMILYLKTVRLIFTKLMRKLSIVSFEIKRLKIVLLCCHGNQSMMECWAKNHDRREEKWQFS